MPAKRSSNRYAHTRIWQLALIAALVLLPQASYAPPIGGRPMPKTPIREPVVREPVVRESTGDLRDPAREPIRESVDDTPEAWREQMINQIHELPVRRSFERARSVLPSSPTSDAKESVVYIDYDATRDKVYYHSNFVRPGGNSPVSVKSHHKRTMLSEFDDLLPNEDKKVAPELNNPFLGKSHHKDKRIIWSGFDDLLFNEDKKVAPELNNPFLAFRKIVLPPLEKEAIEKLSPQEQQARENLGNEADRFTAETVHFILDVSLFDEHGVPRIDLTGVKNIELASNGKLLSVKPELLTTAKPPPRLIAKIKGCCFYGIPPHLADQIGARLQQRPFKPQEVKIASMFISSEVDDVIKDSPHVQATHLKGDGRALRSKEDVLRLIKSASRGLRFWQNRKTLVLLAHVEGSDYVIHTPENSEQLRIPISEVRQMALDNGVPLIDIGCKTVEAIKQELGFGVMTTYDSVKAVRSLQKALKNSTTFRDFLGNLSSEDLMTVVEPSFKIGDITVQRVKMLQRVVHIGKEIWASVIEIGMRLF